MEQKSFRVMEEESGCNECLKQMLVRGQWGPGGGAIREVGELGGLPRRRPGLKA